MDLDTLKKIGSLVDAINGKLDEVDALFSTEPDLSEKDLEEMGDLAVFVIYNASLINKELSEKFSEVARKLELYGENYSRVISTVVDCWQQ